MMPILDGAEMLRAMRETELVRHPLHRHELDAGGERTGRIGDYAASVRKPFQLAFMIQLVEPIRDLDAAALQIRHAGGVPWT